MSRPPLAGTAGGRVLLACLAAIAGVCVGVALHPSAAALLAVAVCTVGFAVAAAALRRDSPRLVLVLGLLCVAGLLRATTVAAPDAAWIATLHGGPAKLLGTVREGTGSRRTSAQVVVDVDRVVHADADQPVHAGVLATLRTGPAVLPGDRVELDARSLRPVAGEAGSAAAVLGREGIDAVAQSPTLTIQGHGGPSPQRLLAVARLRLSALVDGALPEPTASLVDAVAFGIPRPVPADLTAALQDSGLAHVLAVSGLKVVLLAGLLQALCRALAAPPRLRLGLGAAVVGGYVCLTGAGPSAVRAAIMAGVGWGLQGTGRIPDPLPLLGLVGAVMLGVDPGLCRDVGFQLSFLGTTGILLLAGPLAARLPGPRLLREPFAMTLAAQVATLPVTAATFGVISLVGPAANALAVPLLPPLIVVALLGAVVGGVVPALGLIPLQLAGALASLLAALARSAAAIPGAAIHVSGWPPALVGAELAALAGALAAWRVARGGGGARPATAIALRRAASDVPPAWSTAALTLEPAASNRPPLAELSAGAPRLSRRTAMLAASLVALLAGGAVVVAAGRPDGRFHVAVLDVGAARAVLVQSSAGDRALVDTGADPQRLLQALGAALPSLSRSLGLLVLTGGDRAAVGGLPGLASRYRVNRAVVPAEGLGSAARTTLSAMSDQGTAVSTVAADAAWTWGGITWQLLSIDGTAADGTALVIGAPEGRALLLGKLPAAAQEELAALHPDALRADLLVAPSDGAVAAALADAVRPQQVAVPDVRSTGGRASTALLSGPRVRHTASAGTLTYTWSQGGLVAP